jgi:hypothetical protein
MPRSVKAPVMSYLQKQQVIWGKYAADIHNLKKIVVSSMQEDSTDLIKKIRVTDLYRNQNFAETHTKMAKLINYDRS